MADTLQFGPEWLRTLSHGGSSSHLSHSTAGQGLAPSSSRRPKPANIRYSRDEMLTLFSSVESSKPPEGVVAVSDIAVDKAQQPIAFTPQSYEEQHLLSHSSKGTPATIRIDLEPPTRHRGKGGWSETTVSRDDEGLVRNKHSREEFRDESGGKNYDAGAHRGRGGKDSSVAPRHPEFSRSMSSDNWRDAKKREMEVDATPSWRTRPEHNRPARSWRDPPSERDNDSRGGRSRRGSDTLHHDRGDYVRRKGFDRNYGDSDDDESGLPEWSTEDVDDIGTFDASGAFIPMGDMKDFEALESEDTPAQVDDPTERSQPDGESETTETMKIAADEDNGDARAAEKIASVAVGHAEPRNSPVAEATVPDGLHAESSAAEVVNDVYRGDPQAGGAMMAEQNSAFNANALASAENDMDFVRLDFDAENLVASLFLDDEIGSGSDQQPADSKKGFVGADHVDAFKWFYKDPQGVIQGPFNRLEMAEWFNAGFFAHTLLVKRGIDSDFIQLGELIKKLGQDPFMERKSPSHFPPPSSSGPAPGDARPIVAADSSNSQSMEQMQLLQMLLKKQQQSAGIQPLPNVSQQQQQALLHLLLQSQAMQVQSQQSQAAFPMSGIQAHPSTVQTQTLPGQVIRPRAIKSQQSQQLTDAVIQQQQALQRETKLAELSQQSAASNALSMLTADQKVLLQMIKQQQPLASNVGRSLPQSASAFHRSVSQPVDMDLTGMGSSTTAGWNVPTKAASGLAADGISHAMPNLWRGSNAVPSSVGESGGAWKGNYPARMTLEEVEKMQFMSLEKACQLEQQKRQAAEVGDIKTERQMEQLKAALIQQMQQRHIQSGDDRRMLVDRPTEFDMRQRQCQEEIRRRMERADELRQIEMLRSLSSEQTLQMALSAPSNGYGASADQARRMYPEPHQLAARGNFWLPKDIAAGKPTAGLPQWSNQGSAATGYPLGPSKMTGDTNSWEELAASLAGKGAGNGGTVPARGTGNQASKTLKDEGLQMLVQVAAYKEEFARWCDAAVKSLTVHTNINVPTFLRHLAEIDSPQDVAQCVRTYLGNSKETMVFVQQYLEKREIWRQQNKMLQELVLQCMKSGNKW